MGNLVNRIFEGGRVYVVGCGPSLTQSDCDLLRGRNVIAVNLSVRLLPFAQVLYAGDYKWWFEYVDDWSVFEGLRYSVARGVPGVSCLRGVNRPVLCQDGLSLGGTSAYQACNLAYLMGASSICLLGVDCKKSEYLHWHKDHAPPLTNPNERLFKRWIDSFSDMHEALKGVGVDLYNCSRDSDLTIPRMTLEASLGD